MIVLMEYFYLFIMALAVVGIILTYGRSRKKDDVAHSSASGDEFSVMYWLSDPVGVISPGRMVFEEEYAVLYDTDGKEVMRQRSDDIVATYFFALLNVQHRWKITSVSGSLPWYEVSQRNFFKMKMLQGFKDQRRFVEVVSRKGQVKNWEPKLVDAIFWARMVVGAIAIIALAVLIGIGIKNG
jgi:hypothetical protein